MLELPQCIETEREVNDDPDWPATSAQKMSERMNWPLGPQVQEYRLQFKRRVCGWPTSLSYYINLCSWRFCKRAKDDKYGEKCHKADVVFLGGIMGL
jgi:hypothetical protein